MAEENKDFEPITTQEDFDNRIKDRIERAEKHVRKQYEGFDDYKAKADDYDAKVADYTQQISALNGQVESLQAQITKRDTDAAKIRIAKEAGLPEAFASRLSGENEDAWQKDAAELAKFFDKPSPVPKYPSKDSAETVDDKKTADMKKLLKELRGEN